MYHVSLATFTLQLQSVLTLFSHPLCDSDLNNQCDQQSHFFNSGLNLMDFVLNLMVRHSMSSHLQGH